MKTQGNSLLGMQRGKIGPLVGRVVGGEQIYSAYNPVVHNPRTPKQMAHRCRFGTLSQLARTMAGAVNVGFRREADGSAWLSARNLFIGRNMAAVTATGDVFGAEVDYGALALSSGRVPGVGFAELQLGEDGGVEVAFVPFAEGEEHPVLMMDDVLLVLLNVPQAECVVGKACRGAGRVAAKVPAGWIGQQVVAWGFVRTATAVPLELRSRGLTVMPDECSPTVCLGVLALG